jgi:arabinogalactan endo-1,4-beta-galactosidase
MLHLANGGDTAGATWWFDNAVARKVPFDVIGLSQYVYWHGPVSGLQQTMDTVAARYGKDVLVAETSYGFTLAQNDFLANTFDATLQQAGGYPATPQGQAQALRDIVNAVAAVPGHHGLGVFYWEPTWTAVPGNGWDPADPGSGDAWENQALFDYTGKVLPAASVYRFG